MNINEMKTEQRVNVDVFSDTVSDAEIECAMGHSIQELGTSNPGVNCTGGCPSPE